MLEIIKCSMKTNVFRSVHLSPCKTSLHSATGKLIFKGRGRKKSKLATRRHIKNGKTSKVACAVTSAQRLTPCPPESTSTIGLCLVSGLSLCDRVAGIFTTCFFCCLPLSTEELKPPALSSDRA